MTRCPSCGHPVNEADKICNSCGEELEWRQGIQETSQSQHTQQQSTGSRTTTNDIQGSEYQNAGNKYQSDVKIPNSGPQEARKPPKHISTQKNLPFVRGAIYGALSYMTGYIIFAALLLRVGDVGDLEHTTQGKFELVGMAYHNAQFVDASEGANVFDEDIFIESLTGPAFMYRIIPIILLLAAGYLLVKRTNISTPQRGAKFGATIAIGVVVLALVGGAMFKVDTVGGGTATPDMTTSLLLVGIFYPILFGGAGGYLAGSR